LSPPPPVFFFFLDPPHPQKKFFFFFKKKKKKKKKTRFFLAPHPTPPLASCDAQQLGPFRPLRARAARRALFQVRPSPSSPLPILRTRSSLSSLFGGWGTAARKRALARSLTRRHTPPPPPLPPPSSSVLHRLALALAPPTHTSLCRGAFAASFPSPDAITQQQKPQQQHQNRDRSLLLSQNSERLSTPSLSLPPLPLLHTEKPTAGDS